MWLRKKDEGASYSQASATGAFDWVFKSKAKQSRTKAHTDVANPTKPEIDCLHC